MEFTGEETAIMDKQGRIRIPAKFRKSMEKEYGSEVFVTSLDSESVSIYPMAEWRKIVDMLSEKSDDSNLRRFAILAARWGKRERMDNRGRILINKEIRLKTKMQDRIIIEGRENYLVLKSIQ